MIARSGSLLVLGLLALSAAGQQLTITLGFPVADDLLVKIMGTRGADRYVLDSAQVDAQGRALFPGPWPGSGFYQVMLPDSDRVDFIIDTREPKISLVFSGTPLQEQMHVMASEENKRLWEYKLLSRETQAIQAAIQQERARLDGSAFLRMRELDSLDRRAQAVQSNHLTRLISADPKGYFNKAVGAGRVVENALTADDILTRFDFSDADLLRSAVYPKAVMTTIQKQPVYSEDSFSAAADTILNRARSCNDCYTYTLGFLIDLFDQYGPEMVLQGIVEKYVLSADPEPELPARIQDRVESLRKVSVGALAPDVKLPVPGEDSVSIAAIASRSKFLAVMFYSSTCDHCHAQMPGLRDALSAFGSKGFNAIGIALDPDATEFDRCIKDQGITWPCYAEFQGWGSPAAKAFQVKATPTFLVLDKSMRIVAKPKDAEALKQFLGSVL
ncbi:MAG: TlpA disulfide reductase family protein [Flavobacteriales bacterium]